MKNPGTLIELLRAGEITTVKHENPYLFEALQYQDILFTQTDIAKIDLNKEFFSHPERPVVLEIGCYLGKTVLEMAQEFPHINFIGLDLTYKRTVKAARKIKLAKLDNVKIGIVEGKSFLEMIPNGYLSGVCVFFPDPWPKARHAKNRYLAEGFFPLLKDKVKDDGFFWFKTDHAEYYSSVSEDAVKNSWIKKEEQPELFLNKNFVTIFEKVFTEQNLPINRCTFYRARSKQ